MSMWHGRFEEALGVALESKDSLGWVSAAQVGDRLVRELISNGQFQEVV